MEARDRTFLLVALVQVPKVGRQELGGHIHRDRRIGRHCQGLRGLRFQGLWRQHCEHPLEPLEACWAGRALFTRVAQAHNGN